MHRKSIMVTVLNIHIALSCWLVMCPDPSDREGKAGRSVDSMAWAGSCDTRECKAI